MGGCAAEYFLAFEYVDASVPARLSARVPWYQITRLAGTLGACMRVCVVTEQYRDGPGCEGLPSFGCLGSEQQKQPGTGTLQLRSQRSLGGARSVPATQTSARRPGGAPTPALSTPIARTKSAAVLCRAPLRLCPCLCVFVIGLSAPVGNEQRLSLSTGALPTSENLAPHSSRSRHSAGRSAAPASETESGTASVGPFREPARPPPSARALCCALLSFSGLPVAKRQVRPFVGLSLRAHERRHQACLPGG